jgi:hypothetical protein
MLSGRTEVSLVEATPFQLQQCTVLANYLFHTVLALLCHVALNICVVNLESVSRDLVYNNAVT